MKPVIIDIEKMSDSVEIYDSRPNKGIAGFVYLILSLVITVVWWMYFCKVDVVVKGTGTIASSGEVVTVTNQSTGIVEERFVEDGQLVEEGTVLYIVSSEGQLLQLNALEKQLDDSENKEIMLHAYDAWLTDGIEFVDSYKDNIYFKEFSTRKNLHKQRMESIEQGYDTEVVSYKTKVNANEEIISYYEEAINKSKQMIDVIRSKDNNIVMTDSFYWNTVENFLVQYQNIDIQYEDKINQLRTERNAAIKESENLEKKKNELLEQQWLLEEKILNGEYNSSESDNSVSGGNVDATIGIDESVLIKQLQEIETLISAQQAIIDASDRGISDYYIQKNSALNAYEAESIAAIEGTIMGYEQNIASYKGTNQEYRDSQKLLEDKGINLEKDNLRTQEQYNVTEELKTCQQVQEQLMQQIEVVEQNMNNAVVKASVDGYINLTSDLVVGNYIVSGTQVMTIIPCSNEGQFVVKNYVENRDIAKIYEGIELTYKIAAYPTQDYGTIEGKVTFISADLKINNSGSAYYLVETSIDSGQLMNSAGKEAVLKVGCYAKLSL